MARNYKQERKYDGQPHVKAKRAARNRARTALRQALGESAIEGKDVHHKNGDATDNREENLTAKSPSDNRSYPRTKTARKKNSRS